MTALNPRPRTVLLALTLALLGNNACKSEIDDKSAAKVEAAGTATERPIDPDAIQLKLSSSSEIAFIGAKVTDDHRGTFTEISGTATVAKGKLVAIDIVVETDSISIEPEKLETHMKDEDFFAVEQFPQAKFTSLDITEQAAGGATHEIAGNLEMRGETKKVTFPATIEVSDTKVTGKAEFKIDRTLWGITYSGMKDNAIKSEVALELDLAFERG